MATAFTGNGRKSMKGKNTTAKDLAKLTAMSTTRNFIAERKDGEVTITLRSLLPCMTDEDLQRALKDLLDLQESSVAVVGGIVRHNIR